MGLTFHGPEDPRLDRKSPTCISHPATQYADLNHHYLEQKAGVGRQDDVGSWHRVAGSIVRADAPALAQARQVLDVQGPGEDRIPQRRRRSAGARKGGALGNAPPRHAPVDIPLPAAGRFLQLHAALVDERGVGAPAHLVVDAERGARAQGHQGEAVCEPGAHQLANHLAQLGVRPAAEDYL